MKHLLAYEHHKIKHNKILYIVALICCAITIFFNSLDYLEVPMIPGTPNNLLGIFMNETADVGIAVMIIAGCFSIYLFGEDFACRTINLEIISGYSKRSIFLSHCLKIFLLTGSIVSVSLIIGCTKFFFIIPFSFSPDTVLYLIRTFLLIYLLSFSMVSICIIFVVIFQDTARTTVISSVFLFIVCYIMAALVSNYATSGIDNISSPYKNDVTFLLKLYPPYLWRWVLRLDLSLEQIAFAFIVTISWSLIFLSIGYYIFSKKETK